tara:strand:- start:122 stop:910 length:789 start_codon:yes stop_codon:yes gene_type:complete
MVKFFFLIPTLNSTNNLSRLITSFQEQTYKNWRIMFVDGLSNKFHKNKMQEICSISKRITMIHQNINENGIYSAMNEGFKNIKEDELLFFWGDDDWVYSPDTLENLASTIQKNKNNELIICQGQYVNLKTGNLSRKSIFIKNHNNIQLNNKLFRRLLFYGYSPPHQATGFSFGVCKKIGSYSKKLELVADLDLFLKISKFDDLSILNLNNKMVLMSNAGISSRKIYKRLLEVFMVYLDSFGIYFFVPLVMRYVRKISSKIFI